MLLLSPFLYLTVRDGHVGVSVLIVKATMHIIISYLVQSWL